MRRDDKIKPINYKYLTWTEDDLTLRVIILAHAIVTVGFVILARIAVLNEDVWRTELGGAIAVLGDITLTGFSSAHRASWKELR